ncbi:MULTISPECIES: DUF732 domain-containing protein [Streptomyces]|uniref:DUF732 domain-containing protein n=1 Tax=Streptomyces TaxID=1883 RepID=UPI001E4A0CDA|nr:MULTISPECIES: DUF732 domain-containing protein [Streptomyces]UFQ15486.1 DUF732 domain-containing protein [Streptomyces huasconensis]WCL85090.1 DUF732 domain-containing protein [Streptomyces sp. JCM 35825]
MKAKTRNWLVGGAVVLVFGGVLSLFEDDKSNNANPDPKPTATESAKADKAPDEKPSKPAASSGIPSPDPAQTARLIRALRTIEPGLVVKETRAVDRARNVCSDLKSGKDAATVQKNAKLRFEGGTVPSLADDQAANIVTAVKSSFCA